MMRADADEGRVSGLFEVRSVQLLDAVDAITDLPLSSDGGELLLVRRIFASGRSSASINGNPITLQMLRSIGEILVDIHGQHDNQFLLKTSNQLDVLDRFAGAESDRQAYHHVWLELSSTRSQIQDLAASRRLRNQQLDFLKFQAAEIDAAELAVGEYDELTSRSSLLRNLEKIRREADATYAALYEADGSLLERLRMVHAVLSELAMLDSSISPIVETIKIGLIQLEEASFDLGRYTQKLDLDPAELAEVNERLNVINRLIRKYGSTVEQVLTFREQIGQEIGVLERADHDASALETKIAPLEASLQAVGGGLSAKRRSAADRLPALIHSELLELGMEKAVFSVQLTACEPTASGFEQAEFMVQTNPGLPSQPLRKIASGGEIGRLMLGLKSVLAGEKLAAETVALESERPAKSARGVKSSNKHQRASRIEKSAKPAAAEEDVDQSLSAQTRSRESVSQQDVAASVLVFDEIDANIGGRLGGVIGAKLRKLAAGQQILCITHLPQIAAWAARHLTVKKVQSGKSTQTSVKVIEGEDRIAELAEMIGGASTSATTIAQARELVMSAQLLPTKRGKDTQSIKVSRQKTNASK